MKEINQKVTQTATLSMLGLLVPDRVRYEKFAVHYGRGTMAIHEMTRASIFIKGSLKSHLFLIFRNLNHLFSTRKWTPEIRICHGCIRKIERAVRTAERLGCLTINSAIIAVIRSLLMGPLEQTTERGVSGIGLI